MCQDFNAINNLYNKALSLKPEIIISRYIKCVFIHNAAAKIM